MAKITYHFLINQSKLFQSLDQDYDTFNQVVLNCMGVKIEFILRKSFHMQNLPKKKKKKMGTVT